MHNLLLVFIIAAGIPANPIKEWDTFEKSVRDQQINRDSARIEFRRIFKQLKDYASQYQFSPASKWVFPLQGYSIKDAGKGGFKPDIRYGSSPIKGYNFYDGNNHGGHPAYDIFIHDTDMDCIDDNAKKPVNVVSPVDLLIISVYSDWQTGSEIRGGNYIWALQPQSDMLFYFAHLDSVVVVPGAFCKAGTLLATLGRTGKSASSAKSPTHLHLMVLKVEGEDLVPFDYWGCLQK